MKGRPGGNFAKRLEGKELFAIYILDSCCLAFNVSYEHDWNVTVEGPKLEDVRI